MSKLLILSVLALSFGFQEVIAQDGIPAKAETEEVRKKWEEYQKQVAEIQEKNRKITETNDLIAAAFKEGLVAYEAKNYQLAAEKFDLCYRLDPDFAGTATVALLNKAMSLRALGMLKYNEAVLAKRDPVKAGLRFFSEAVSALETSKALNSTADVPTDEETKRKHAQNVLFTAKEMVLSLEVLMRHQPSRLQQTLKAFDDYLALEPDAAQRAKFEERLNLIREKFNVRSR